MTGLDYS